MNKIRLFVMTALFALLSAVSLQLTAPDQAKAYGAYVPEIKQDYSNWCWAASGAAVSQYKGKNVSQYNFAYAVKGGYYNNPATSSEIQRGLSTYGLRSRWTNYYGNWQYPNYSFIQSQINNGRPMIPLIWWTNGATIGHFVVLDGYFTSNNNNYVEYMDPWYGDHYYMTFQAFKSNNNFYWRELIYDIGY
ncbi:papain-like cysteine protease family protein [Laceyella sacchari]|uniref:C39 family peptidase n=1 Tax=Laceyella sacchari TaxID=37482 RepID=A0ABY5U9A7_LACSH|nr:papain-like cysteine protease family protein [Laceyella sacchari]UWE04907.1 C39 family peptidase [Laceyella sacchari]